jgi:Na+-translocating ferredoxin:NAD+ oxidoreductase subunit B
LFFVKILVVLALKRVKMAEKSEQIPGRRRFLEEFLRYAVLGTLGVVGGTALAKRHRLVSQGCAGDGLCTQCELFAQCFVPQRWQINPAKCVACGNCATYCVLEQSAVKAVKAFPICGYCRICFGFFEPAPYAITEGAENQLCPTGAIIRKFVEEPYYEYLIDEPLCIGCGKCVKGCNTFGNGSLFLQVRHDRCLNCNQCAIAAACPSGAFERVPADKPYLLKKMEKA